MSNRVILVLTFLATFVLGIVAGSAVYALTHEHDTTVRTAKGFTRSEVFDGTRQAWKDYPAERKQNVCSLYYGDQETVRAITLAANDGDMVASVWSLEVQDSLCRPYKE